tara:strand:+ start:192 stop:347 length:156 start_codon:yes stop_codon:yes gene_type:complete
MLALEFLIAIIAHDSHHSHHTASLVSRLPWLMAASVACAIAAGSRETCAAD